jgi:tetratricopeptide (TPR) repeat protein
VGFDREDALRKAEKLLRQGRLEGAIAEYLRVVEHQPRDWNTANLLGDLYVRAGQTESAVAQYSRIAENLAQEGFVPKAAALYKKIVKIAPEDESGLLRASELAAQQGLTADAKSNLTAAYQLRLRRGDRFGAAQLATRLAALDPADLSGRLNAAKANAEWGDRLAAAKQYKAIAAELTQRGQPGQALEVLTEAVQLDPTDAASRTLLVRGLLDGGDIESARRYAAAPEDLRTIAAELLIQGREDEALQMLAQVLAADPADADARVRLARAYIARRDLTEAAKILGEVQGTDDPQLLLALAEIELRAKHVPEAGRVLRSLLLKDKEQSSHVVMLGCALGENYPEAGFECISAVVDLAMESDDLEGALSVVERFVARARTFVPGLLKLVEICVDGSFEHNLYRAQAQLADAYLASASWAEARAVSEDLLDRRPDDLANTERLKAALRALGVADADAVVVERLRKREQPVDPFEFSRTIDFEAKGKMSASAQVADSEVSAADRTSDGIQFGEVPAAPDARAPEPPAVSVRAADTKPQAPAPAFPVVEMKRRPPVQGVPVVEAKAPPLPPAAPVVEATPQPTVPAAPVTPAAKQPPAQAAPIGEAKPQLPLPAAPVVKGAPQPPAAPPIEEPKPQLSVPASPIEAQRPEPPLPAAPAVETRNPVVDAPDRLMGAAVTDRLAGILDERPDTPAPPSVQDGPDVIEIDLSDALAELLNEPAFPTLPASVHAARHEAPIEPAAEEPDAALELSSADDLEGFFGQYHTTGGLSSSPEAAMSKFIEAQASLRAGHVDQARESLQYAVRSPAVRFDAASLLGRIARDSGDGAGAVEWFERAAEAPSPTPTAGHALLYDLGDTLESLGERARALAVFMELRSAAPDYRDVAQRIEWLSNAPGAELRRLS